jgi:lipopolysaccharide heptosyltransferase I
MEVQLPLQGEKKYSPPVGFSKKSGEDTPPDPQSICILRLSSIGDIIHTLPVAQLLKQKYPNARIAWVAEKGMAPLLKHSPAIDQLILADTKGWRRRFFSPEVWQEVFRFLRYLRSQEYDVALDFQGLFKSAVLARICGSSRRIGMSRYDRKERWSSFLLNEFSVQTASKPHIVEKNIALLERLEIAPSKEPLHFHIHPETEAVEYVERELKKLELEHFVLIHAGGGWVTKIWEADNFAQLIDGIYSDLHIPALLLWGPGEKHLADKIALKCISPAMASFSTNLSELIALTGRARLMVSGDSGPLHLASALGVPVVGIYGPTDPRRNGPWNPHDSACTIHYECSPCYQRTCPIGIQCLKQLEVMPVLDAVKRTFYLSASLRQNQ